MNTNTLKTMQFILAEVQEFCQTNIATLYQTTVDVQRYQDGAIYIDATIVEQFAEPLQELHLTFSSEDDDWRLDAKFEAFRNYVNLYNKQHHHEQR